MINNDLRSKKLDGLLSMLTALRFGVSKVLSPTSRLLLYFVVMTSNLPSFASADNYSMVIPSHVRLDQTGTLRTVPTLNQEDSQLCYAFSAAQMLDTVRIATGLVSEDYRFTSPFYVGLASFFHPITISSGQVLSSSSGPSRLDYGWAWRAFEQTASMGFCEGSKIHGPNGLGDLSIYWQVYEKLVDLAITFDSDEIKFLNEASKITKDAFIKNQIDLTLLPNQTFYLFLFEQTKKMVKLTGSSEGKRLLSKENAYLDRQSLRLFLESSCKKMEWQATDVLTKLPKVRIKEGFDQSGIKERIDKSLSGDNSLKSGIPVVIDFCSFSLTKPDEEFTYDPSSFVDQCGFHSVLVIGKRTLDSGKLEYLIRDFQRPKNGCRPLAKEYTCEDEQGQYWAPAEILIKNIQYISFVL